MTGTGGTVLAVDDDSDCRQLYRLWLADSYEVRTATDGAAALEALDGSVDVVLLDREMPGTDGETVAAELRSSAEPPSVVMVSGVEPGVDLLDVPVDDYLRKPVRREAARSALRRARAVADCRPRVRRLLALARRVEVVQTSAAGCVFAGNDRYRRALDRLDRHQRTLSEAETALPAGPGGERPRPLTDSSLRESP